MSGIGNVQSKVSCLYETDVIEEPSSKRQDQNYKVVASDRLKTATKDHEITNAVATEKIDGTCVYVSSFKGLPWLWARFDRKPNKGAERRFRKFQNVHRAWQAKMEGDEPRYNWDIYKDFREMPEDWVPADGTVVIDGVALPNNLGHIQGWVPVKPTSKQYCWHLSCMDQTSGQVLVLSENESEQDSLKLTAVSMSELMGQTAELIGTKVNANPYGMGSKTCPIHCLVIHGSIKLQTDTSTDRTVLTDWFNSHMNGKVEGIVWHCDDGAMFKLHRHHVGLPWPVREPALSVRRVTVEMSLTESCDINSPMRDIVKINGHTFESLEHLSNTLCQEMKEVSPDH